MRIDLAWLSDFVDLPSLAEICQRLVSAGVEVEAVFDPASSLSGVVVADIVAAEAHPKADRLRVCSVSDGTDTFQVVCGAPNARAGLRVPYARMGAQLPSGRIEARRLRGVDSQGMLCGRDELGLHQGARDQGLWELPQSYVLGNDVLAEAQISAVLTLGITPNRPDLLSHLGVARELAAFSGKRSKPSKWRLTEKGPDAGSLARVLVEDSASCRRYVARVVRNLRPGPSPDWLRQRLESIGQRSINNIVDVTNYVMHELGLPLHAFDLSRLGADAGLPTIRVRRATQGEKLRTLDNIDRVLTEEDLVIADANRAIALAGIMGGADSEVTDNTVSVLLEAAFFEPMRVSSSAKRHGIRSEASLRFGRGADPGMLLRAVDRCAQLLGELADGEVAKGILECSQKIEMGREIALRIERIPKVLGIALSPENLVQLLEPLEIRCVNRTEGALVFEAPSFRPDISREIDVIEEVARRHGYERIPERLPDTGADYVYEPMAERASDCARQAMLAAGCYESVTYGFGSPSWFAPYEPQEGKPLRIVNPLGEEQSALRTSLIPGLLHALSCNQQRGRKHLRLFEVGTTFHRRTPQPDEDERDRDLPRENQRVSVVISGGRAFGRWYEGREGVDFSDVVGVVEHLLQAFDRADAVQILPSPVTHCNPACSAEVRLGSVVVGTAGQLVPEALAHFQLTGAVYLAELSLTCLAGLAPRQIVYSPLPKYPSTRRDLALVADRSLASADIERFIYAHAGGGLGKTVVERVWLFDVYRGKPIPVTQVSLGFAIEYRSPDRTLTDSEVNEAFGRLPRLLSQEFGIEVRQ